MSVNTASIETALRSTCAFVMILLFCGCNALDSYDEQIKKASDDIESAASDAQRANAYADRGRGYSNKARLALMRALIGPEEYGRLFDLAMKDHDQAVALDPGNAELYFLRGLSNYDRAAFVNEPGSNHAFWFEAARADFVKAVKKNPGHFMAYDYLGRVDEQTGRIDQAIIDYTHEMELNPRLGRSRLADLYCNRGQAFFQKKLYAQAVPDFEKSIDLGLTAEGCSCDPYNPLAYIYINLVKDYSKGRELLRKSRACGNRLAPEYVEKLKKGTSGSD